MGAHDLQRGLNALRRALAEVLEQAGSPFDLQIWPGQMHVFQLFNRMLPEADEAMREAGRFIRKVVGDDSVTEAA